MVEGDRNDEQIGSNVGRTVEEWLRTLGKGRSRLSISLERGLFLCTIAFVCVSFCLARHFYNEEFSFCSFCFVALFSISLIVFLGWVLCLVHPWFRIWWVRVLGGCVLFVWGFMTYFYFPSAANDARGFWARTLRAANRTTTTMFTRRGGYGKPYSFYARMNYGLFQTALIFYLAAILFSVFGRTAINNLQKLLIWNDELLHVFWGLSERDRLLARSVRRINHDARIEFNLPKSMMYKPIERARLMDLADEVDAFWMFVNLSPDDELSGRTFLRAVMRRLHDWCTRNFLGLSVVKGRYHYFLDDDGHANLAMADRLARKIICNDALFGNWHFFVRAGDVDNEELFNSWAAGVYKQSGQMIAVTILRDPEMVARDFVSQYPPIDANCVKPDPDTGMVDGQCRTLLLGFDRVGRELLNVSLCISAFVGKNGTVVHFPFTVVDMNAKRWDRYRLSVPGLFDGDFGCDLEFKCMQVGLPEFEEWFRKNHKAFDRIVLCMNDDAVNLREGLRIRDMLIEEPDSGRKDIYVRIRDPRLANVKLMPDSQGQERFPLRVFGDLRRMYSADSLHSELLDRLAAVMNWKWHMLCEKKSDVGVCQSHDGYKDLQDEINRYWADDSEYNRKSSKILVLRCLTFCRIWGLRFGLDELRGAKLDAISGKIKDVEDAIKRIFQEPQGVKPSVFAKMEHRRWNTYMRICGWRPLTDGMKAERGCRLNHIASCRRHAGMVPFDGANNELVEKSEFGWRVLIDALRFVTMVDRQVVLDHSEEDIRGDLGRGSAKDVKDCPNKDVIVRLAELADIYQRSIRQKTVELKLGEDEICDRFLNSKELRHCEGVSIDSFEVFWFRDAISPHFDFRRRRCYKTRFPYVYNRNTGMITPFCSCEKSVREKLLNSVKRNDKFASESRLVDFTSQPNFIARIKRERVNGQGAIVIAFCGTQSIKDWSENILQYLGFTPPQFRLAADLVKAVRETADDDAYIYLTGHSEGGGEVQYALMRNATGKYQDTRISGCTFNSQRLSARVLRALGYGKNVAEIEKYKRSIINIRMGGDVVSGWAKLGCGLVGEMFGMPGNSYFVRPSGRLKSLWWRIKVHSLRSVETELRNAWSMKDESV